MAYAFFDFDHTLIKENSQWHAMLDSMIHDPCAGRFEFVKNCLIALFIWFVNPFNWFRVKSVFKYQLMRGFDKRTNMYFDGLGSKMANFLTVKEDIKKILDDHYEQGDRVIILTASPVYYMRTLLDGLGIRCHEVYGTEFVKDPIFCCTERHPDDDFMAYLGIIEGNEMIGVQKAAKIQEITSGDNAKRYAYGNLPHDEFMFKVCDEYLVVPK